MQDENWLLFIEEHLLQLQDSGLIIIGLQP